MTTSEMGIKIPKQMRYRKHCLRAIFRSIAMIFLVIVAVLYTSYFSHSKNGRYFSNNHTSRSLSVIVDRKGEECDNVRKLGSTWMLIPCIGGVVYMFLAIAIVCDEFFVPALEVLAGEEVLNLSMDVAGATLMAAGGSAPELFTSLIGTFSESDVGFGTIVGSAAFNVLFVIGMCAIFSLEELTLSWWPLARDCFCYSISLCTLALFCGYVSPGRIEIWESAILFLLYVSYVIVMKYNKFIYSWVKMLMMSTKVGTEQVENTIDSARTHTFRVGLMRLLIGKGSILDRAGIGLITKMPGDVKTVFKTVDESGDGFIDRVELGHMITNLQFSVKESELEDAITELDENGDGRVDLHEFSKWHQRSLEKLKAKLKQTFDLYDVDASGSIDKHEMKEFLKAMGSNVDENAVEKLLHEIHSKDNESSHITFDELQDWFIKSSYIRDTKIEGSCGEDDEGNIVDNLYPPSSGSTFDYVKWLILFPILFILCFTIPDVRQSGKSKYCLHAFFLSIIWIGAFTYLMVFGAEIIGNTLGIPMILMGLTFLAAGTSVPDLLSSVIVARMGEGDMAVSSSLGSNIFDITVGLPIPWLIFCFWPNKSSYISISADGVETSIFILLGMLICIINVIHWYGWKMTRSLGMTMFVLYFLYLIQAILRELPFSECN